MTDTDISETLAAKVDQITFEDVRPPIERLVTITGTKVTKGADQPVALTLAEFPDRPYKPGKSMRRVLAAIWGPDSAVYVGRQLLLYGDPTVQFGGMAVGGIRIRAMSHLDKPQKVALTVTRGKRAPFVVQPLPDAPTPAQDRLKAPLTAIRNAPTLEALGNVWERVEKGGLQETPELVQAYHDRAAQLSNE